MTARRYRQPPADRKAAILDAAVTLATADGYRTLTILRVAAASSVSPALVAHYYNSTSNLLAVVMEEAVRRRVLSVVAEGLAHRHPAAIAAPACLKQQAAATLAGEL